MPAELTLCFFFFFFFLCFHFSSYISFLFFFLVFYFAIPIRWLLLWFSPPFLHKARALFYSACHDRILLYQPLTTFVQFGCTCRRPFDRLYAAPYHQTKKTILFVSLPWHPFLLRCGCLLSLYPSWHAPSGSNSTLPVQVVCHPNKTLPPKEPWQESQNRFSPLPTTKPCHFTSYP